MEAMTLKNMHDFDPRNERCRKCGCPRYAVEELDNLVICGRVR